MSVVYSPCKNAWTFSFSELLYLVPTERGHGYFLWRALSTVRRESANDGYRTDGCKQTNSDESSLHLLYQSVAKADECLLNVGLQVLGHHRRHTASTNRGRVRHTIIIYTTAILQGMYYSTVIILQYKHTYLCNQRTRRHHCEQFFHSET